MKANPKARVYMGQEGRDDLFVFIRSIRADKNNCAACEKLFSRFYPYMYSLVSRRCPAGGSEFDEMLEILRIALFDAVLSYDEGRGDFLSYATTCMKNRLSDYIRSLRAPGGEFIVPLGEEMDAIASGEDIEGDFVSRESYMSALSKAKEVLSDFQFRVLVLESEGYSTMEIAKKLSTGQKRVDNAKYRTRKNAKIREIFSELR